MPAPAPLLIASLQQLMQLQEQKKYPQTAEALWSLLMSIFFENYVVLSPEEEKLFGLLGKVILKIFADPEFQIPEKLVFDYVNCTVLISNLVYHTEFKNSDLVLKLLLEQKAPISKILPLYSFRNRISLDMEQIFRRSPALVFGWMTVVLSHGHTCCLDPESGDWCKRLLQLKAFRNQTDFLGPRRYYQLLTCCTYIDHTQDRAVKSAINKAFKGILPKVAPPQNCNMKKILIVSSLMFPAHAVYKSMSPLLAGLAEDYEIVTIAPPPTNAASVIVNGQEIKNSVQHQEWTFNTVLPRIQKEEAGIIIYPEIGMDLVPIELSNLRLAPIQIAMYGHPVSSFAGEIDYFIGSADGEIREDIQDNYSERVVLIPGLAAISVYPEYQLHHPPRRADHVGKVIINCAWGSMKLNSQMIMLLKKVLERSNVNIVFRFTDIWGRYFSFLQIVRDLEAILGKAHVECLPPLAYKDYMYTLEEGDFALDSYPFCGFNRTTDTLFCGKPMVVLEGTKFYNRAGGVILRKIGLGELVATDEEAFITTIVRMAEDSTYRQEMTARVQATDLRQSVCNTEPVPYFKQAIDTIIRRDAEFRRQKSREPIIIPVTE